MSNTNQSLTSPDLWIRLVYMVVFWLLSYIARVVIGAVGVIQFFVVLFSGETNRNLKNLGEGTARWTQQNYLFLCFASEQKPFPFQDWPSPEDTSPEDNGDGETAVTEPKAHYSATEPTASEKPTTAPAEERPSESADGDTSDDKKKDSQG